jgi:transcription-repair coupling factor (superfamily II helicase)
MLILTGSAREAEDLTHEIRFFAPDLPVALLPDYETLPYDPFSPHPELVAERLAVLYRLSQGQPLILVANGDSLTHRLPPPDYVVGRSLLLAVGQRIDLSEMRRQLIGHGYVQVPKVVEHGEFAVRGALMDLFPAGSSNPVRVDLFDDEIEALRIFDAQTQLSTDRVDDLQILPAREFPTDAAGIRLFRENFRHQFPIDPAKSSIYRDVSEGRMPAGIEYFLPLFFTTSATLLDYLPADTVVISTEDAAAARLRTWNVIQERYEQLSVDREQPCLPPELAFHGPASLDTALQAFKRITVQRAEVTSQAQSLPFRNFGSGYPQRLSATGTAQAERSALDGLLSEAAAAGRVLIVAETPGRRELIRDMLSGWAQQPALLDGWSDFVSGDQALAITLGDMAEGLRLENPPLSLITERQLFADRARTSRRRRAHREPDAVIRELTDLEVGAPVVHEEYGVGRYLGLRSLQVNGVATEFLTLEYADGDKLYVPVHNLHLISRYTGAAPEHAPLHKLGTDQWAKARRRAAEKIRDVAAELLDLYARRAARRGTRFVIDEDAYSRFRLGFPFEETDDQLHAIEQVIGDMSQDTPMDRVVCGDVGFGKTEVALRAAFLAVEAGFQVAVLVPTTLLAQQHFNTFRDRFADWPVEVELLSRFRTGKQASRVLDGIQDGRTDIVIGTHKLLQKRVSFKRLGLVIIDEEHRFGVRHKEALKKLRADVDLLTLTATPIPRTLNMALGGLRELSLIATPPAERLAVKTFVTDWNLGLIREALLREIRRGGQVYLVNDKIETIDELARKVAELVPEASVRIGHGRMSERELEKVMVDFYHRRFDVLVCTTIIESGIDVPSANTIIINRANHFGLAQLHQLRGRVGRSHHQAYAYLIAPPKHALTPDAVKRLEAIEALETLGAGFTLATHDLEIRGAGELLGEEQSGQIQQIGFTLYNELLARAVSALKAGNEPALLAPLDHGPEINLGIAALIPEDYMPDVHMRLVQYKRIASAESKRALHEIQVQLIDRFGLIPGPTRNLFAITGLKLKAQSIGLEKIEAGAHGGFLQFGERTALDPIALVDLVEQEPQIYQLDGPYKLRIRWQLEDPSQRVANLNELLDRLSPAAASASAA